MDPWKISIYQQLKQRNRWQKDHYELIFDAYITLLSTSRSHRHRSYELEQELSNLRQSMLTGRSPSSSVHTLQEIQSPDGRSSFSQSFSGRSGPALEEKVLKLQEELTAAYRLQSENSNTFLRLKEQAEKDEKALLAKEEEFTKQSQLLKTVQEERDQHAQRIKFMETTIDILRKEVESSRAILLDTEKKVHELANENKILIDQMLKIKQEQARELNQMNDLVTQATRDKELAAQRALEIAKQAEQKHTHVDGVNVEMDISNSNSIIDHVAWQSNFNVTIPTERKRTVRAHRGQVTCVRYNAKGTVLISGGTDGMVKVYDAFRGVCKGSLKGAKESVMNVCISLDDAMVLGAGNDKTARIWALKTGKEMHTLLGHTNKIYAAAFSTDNTKVVTGSHDRTIRIWDLMDGVCKRSILCHSSCNYLSLAPNGNLMASAHMDNHLRFWSLNTGELMHDLSEIHTQQATSCEFSRDGTLIITNSRDSTLKLLDVRTFKVIKTLEGTVKEPYRNAINWNRACFSPDSQYVIAGAASGSIFVWNVDTGKIDSVLPAANPAEHPYDSSSSSSTIPDTAISCVDWNRNGRQIVSADNMGNIHFWE